jgi:hypothetical protein
VETWRKSQKWFPKTNEFLQLCDSINRRMTPALPPPSYEPWIVKAGDTGPPDDENPPPKEESLARLRETLTSKHGPLGPALMAKFGLPGGKGAPLGEQPKRQFDAGQRYGEERFEGTATPIKDKP